VDQKTSAAGRAQTRPVPPLNQQQGTHPPTATRAKRQQQEAKGVPLGTELAAANAQRSLSPCREGMTGNSPGTPIRTRPMAIDEAVVRPMGHGGQRMLGRECPSGDHVWGQSCGDPANERNPATRHRARHEAKQTKATTPFYAEPRFVHHLDAGFRQRLNGRCTANVCRRGACAGSDGAVGSSPPNPSQATKAGEIGIGLNAGLNWLQTPRLDRHFVQNAPNLRPLPWPRKLDAVLVVAVAGEYLQHRRGRSPLNWPPGAASEGR